MHIRYTYINVRFIHFAKFKYFFMRFTIKFNLCAYWLEDTEKELNYKAEKF